MYYYFLTWIGILASSVRTLHLALSTENFLIFFSKSFKLLFLHLRPWSIWVNCFKNVKFRSRFIFMSMDVQLLQHHLLKKLPSSIELLLFLCHELDGNIYVDLFPDSLFCFINPCVHPSTFTTAMLTNCS